VNGELESIREQRLRRHHHLVDGSRRSRRGIAVDLRHDVPSIVHQPCRAANELEWLQLVREADQAGELNIGRLETSTRDTPQPGNRPALTVLFDRRHFEHGGLWRSGRLTDT